MDPIPILITSSVIANAPFTELKGKEERLTSMLNGLKNLSKFIGSEVSIVLCDGSGYSFEKERDLLHSIFEQIEIISFHNNGANISVKGKGYGEGEIIKYALQNSQTLKDSRDFAKLTGKIWIDNYYSCLKSYNGLCGFVFENIFRPTYIDTRFYIVNRSFFEKYLVDEYLKVSDIDGCILEKVFFNKIRTLGLMHDFALKNVPNLYGISGTTAKKVRSSRIKKLVKRFLIILILRTRFWGFYEKNCNY